MRCALSLLEKAEGLVGRWRVTESSSIILLLLDSRCPALHAPPSLRKYIQSLKPNKEVILVLTKADLVDPEAVRRWKEWIMRWWGGEGVQVVSVMSYDLEMLHSGQSSCDSSMSSWMMRVSGKAKHKPSIPEGSMEGLISALRTAHERLLTPPSRVSVDPEKRKGWRAPVRRHIDWFILTRHDVRSGSEPPPSTLEAAAEASRAKLQESDERRDPDSEPLTIGLVGQPNVGKSSLLNALLGEQRVRASRTPGKVRYASISGSLS